MLLQKCIFIFCEAAFHWFKRSLTPNHLPSKFPGILAHCRQRKSAQANSQSQLISILTTRLNTHPILCHRTEIKHYINPLPQLIWLSFFSLASSNSVPLFIVKSPRSLQLYPLYNHFNIKKMPSSFLCAISDRRDIMQPVGKRKKISIEHH